MTESNVLMWLDELRFSTESYEPAARPLSGGGDLSLLLRRSVMDQAAWASRDFGKRTSDSGAAANRISVYENLWDCSSAQANNNNSAGSKGTVDGERTSMGVVRHAEECRVSVVFQDCEEVEDIAEPVKIENIELFLTKDVLDWITELWYSSEEEDVEEFEEFEKYQQERVENRSPTPKFPVVPEVQLRKSNSLKPNRGSSRSNTIHIVHTNPNRTEKDILISGPLKLTWLNTGLIENIERGAVVYRNGMLEIRYDANKPRIEMKMNSTMKNNKIWEFYNPDQNIRVSVDRQHQITMGSPRERRKSVEEESPKNMNKQNLLIKLLRRRSDKQLLEKKGIFKNEDIFGNKLSVLYDNSKAEVHEFVRRAVELIETDKNIKSEHIYRLSGNMATIQKIRLKIDGKNYRVLDEYKNDVDVLTGCLKLFFRELVEPLIPFKTFEELHKLTGKAAGPERDKAVKAVVKSMKTPHRENLQFLIHHLLIVESYKQFNKMTVQSLSIVWGPSMLWYPGVEKCPAYSPYEFSMLVNGVLELILMTYQTDFDSNLQTLSKNDSRGVSWKELDTISEENAKKSPSGSSSSKWLFGMRKGDSKDKLTASNWSLTDTKKDKPADGYFGKPLESLPKSEVYPHVPKLIVQLTELIERHPNARGLYLKPANKDALGKFKKKLQKNKYDVSKIDPLDAALILTKFLQDSEAPLFPVRMYHEFLDNFEELDIPQKTYLVREGIANLSVERQATIEYLVLHVLKVLDCQDSDGKEYIKNAWLPVFSNSSIFTLENETYLTIMLDIYQSKRNSAKEQPSFSLPLKNHFEHRFNFRNDAGMVKTSYTRISDSSVSDSVYSDVDSLETHSRCNSDNFTSADFEIPSRDVYKSSVSFDETRKSLNVTGRSIKEDISSILNSRGKINNSELMVKIYNPFADSKTKDVDNVPTDIDKNVVRIDFDRPTMSTFKNVNAVDEDTRKDVDTSLKDTKTGNVDETINDINDNMKRSSIENISMDIKSNSALDNSKKDVGKPSATSLFKAFNFSNLRRKSDRGVDNNDESTNDINKTDIKNNAAIDVKPLISASKNINITGSSAAVRPVDSKGSGNNVPNNMNKTLVDNTKKLFDKPPAPIGKKFNFSNLKRNADKTGTNVRKISPINIGNPILVNTTNDIDILTITRPNIDKSKLRASPILDNRKDVDSRSAEDRRPSIDRSKVRASPILDDRKDVDSRSAENLRPSIDRSKVRASPILDNRKDVDSRSAENRRPSIDRYKVRASPILDDRKDVDSRSAENLRPSIDRSKVRASPILDNRKDVESRSAEDRRPRSKVRASPILDNRKNVESRSAEDRRPSIDRSKVRASPILDNRKDVDSRSAENLRPSIDKSKVRASPILGNRKDVDSRSAENLRPSIDKSKVRASPILDDRKDVDSRSAENLRPSIDKSKVRASPILDDRKDVDSRSIENRRPSIEKPKSNNSPITGRKDIDIINKTSKWPSIDKIKTSTGLVQLSMRKNIDTSSSRPSIGITKPSKSPILSNQRKNVNAETRAPSIDRTKASPNLGNSRKNVDITNAPAKKPGFDNTKRTESNIKSDKAPDELGKSVDANTSNRQQVEQNSKSIAKENDNTKKDIGKISVGLKSNLNKIMAGQTLENARARAEMMSQKKT